MKPIREIAAHPRVELIEHDQTGGAFKVKRPMGSKPLLVIVGTGLGWDHVSVTLKDRTPNYKEMKLIKRIFFKPDEWAYELHPPPKDYISVNDNVLHLWRPQDVEIPTPPAEMV